MGLVTRFVALALTLLAIVPTAGAQPPPPLVGDVGFDDVPVGAGIAKDRYRSEGILLDCTPGHWLYSAVGGGVEISPGGFQLWIGVEFVVPGTAIPGAVQRTDILVSDANRRGYEYEYLDVHGNPANSGSNRGNYHIGDGWYYSDGPVAHRFVLHVGDGQNIGVDELRFSAIANGGPLAVDPSTWTAVRLLYRR